MAPNIENSLCKESDESTLISILFNFNTDGNGTKSVVEGLLQQTHAQPRHLQKKFHRLPSPLFHALICVRQCRFVTADAAQTELCTGQQRKCD